MKGIQIAGIVTAGVIVVGGAGLAGADLVMNHHQAASVVRIATPKPTPTKTKIIIKHKTVVKHKAIVVQPAPAPAPAAPAPAPGIAAGLTACGTGTQGEEVYAEASTTSCPFALNVEQAYDQSGAWYQSGTSQFYASSPVTGQTYLMTSSSAGDPVVVTGGNGALVEFNY